MKHVYLGRANRLPEPLKAAIRRDMRAETIAGQIKSATTEGVLADKIREWEQLIGRKWFVPASASAPVEGVMV
jgi:hypothetical protein